MKKYVYSAAILFIAACAGQQAQQQPGLPQLPVINITAGNATTWTTYPTTIEGVVNVDIRPQVAGYLDKIFVEEGAYVTKGQPLFKINPQSYNETATYASASIAAAKAAIDKAQVEVNRLQPLVQNKVIAPVQLKAAQANLDAAKATYAQAISSKGSADITVGYTLISAPISGYVGHLPYKQGSLVGNGEPLPLAVISDVQSVHAYFSMSEADFLSFIAGIPGTTTEDKIKHIPAVALQLPDNSIYQEKGTVELVQGQFDRNAGSISFRANFTNASKLLRSGLTGKIRIPSIHSNQLLVPQEATYELQDKVFVFALGDSNKVISKQLTVTGKSGNHYLISGGINSGETIVYSGIQRLRDGAQIIPQKISADSVLQASLLK